LFTWAAKIRNYFFQRIFSLLPDRNVVDLVSINDEAIFVPFVSFFEEKGGNSDESALVSSDSSTCISDLIFSYRDVNKLLAEQVRSLNEKFGVVAKTLYREAVLPSAVPEKVPEEKSEKEPEKRKLQFFLR
jgi:hypothetical protein